MDSSSRDIDPKMVIEAALFASGKMLSVRELSDLSDVTEDKARILAEELAKEYSIRNGGMEIIRFGDGYAMQVRTALVPRVVSVAPKEIDAPLIRTLAIIAYKQPIKQSVLAEIRGNKSYAHVKDLEKMGLISCVKQGRTKVITTTKAFADYFGLGSDRPESVRRVIMKDKRPIGVTPMYESLALRLGLDFIVVNAYKPDENDLERLSDIDFLVIAPGYADKVRVHYSGKIIEASVGTLSQLKESAEKICAACGSGNIEILASEIDALLKVCREKAKTAKPIRPLTSIAEDIARDLRISVQADGVAVASDCSGLNADVLLPTHQPYDMDILERIRQRYERILARP
ncbi:MAG: SMC-Scp complex subunit ScpB [Methanotrichaceae archaeon]